MGKESCFEEHAAGKWQKEVSQCLRKWHRQEIICEFLAPLGLCKNMQVKEKQEYSFVFCDLILCLTMKKASGLSGPLPRVILLYYDLDLVGERSLLPLETVGLLKKTFVVILTSRTVTNYLCSTHSMTLNPFIWGKLLQKLSFLVIL